MSRVSRSWVVPSLIWTLAGVAVLLSGGTALAQPRRTVVSAVGAAVHINGVPTYQGRAWTTAEGETISLEGLLLNARLVQGLFDDLNPDTRGQWAYPDTGRWDPDRNTSEFIEAMAVWRAHGLLGFTLNLQGGCPYGYCRQQPWENSAFAPDGSLRPAYFARLARVLDRADELGMVVLLGYFYFGQDDRLTDEAAVTRAVDLATAWVLERGYTNVLVEVNNECNVNYDHAILRCDRVHELIERVRQARDDGRSLLAGTSLGGGSVPPDRIVAASDFVLLHGNGVRDPERLVEMSRQVRALPSYRPMPILNNEDDQPWRVSEQGWGDRGNNFVEAIRHGVSWGFFDFRLEGEHEDINLGYQSVPVHWQISSDRKRAFFEKLATMTGSRGTPVVTVRPGPEPGRLVVEVERLPAGATVVQIDVLLDNQVVATVTSPGEVVSLSVPQREHWVRARVVYRDTVGEIVVTSPHYRTPWWPYGGPPR